MERDDYVSALRDLLSRDPARIRDANRVFFSTLVGVTAAPGDASREADLVLAEVAATV
jgi:hypothetical protein